MFNLLFLVFLARLSLSNELGDQREIKTNDANQNEGIAIEMMDRDKMRRPRVGARSIDTDEVMDRDKMRRPRVGARSIDIDEVMDRDKMRRPRVGARSIDTEEVMDRDKMR